MSLALEQTLMIEQARQLCQEDEQLVAALLYGSFTRGEGDRYSDIEMVLFFEDEVLPHLDQQTWVAQIAPVALYFEDDIGHHTAIFQNLVRGEFHFYPASDISIVSGWQGNAWFSTPESTILVDRTGALAQYLTPLIGPPPERNNPETAYSTFLNFINWSLFGFNVLARGELARALELLTITHRHLLRMIRLVEDSTTHWPTPSKGLEADLSVGAYERFKSCTGRLDEKELWQAYNATWQWGMELMRELVQSHELPLSEPLIAKLTQYFKQLPSQ
jgi:lincosamide nucleotidyltransferase